MTGRDPTARDAVSPDLDALERLLLECSAQVKNAAGGRGSGFFIDGCLLLTCAHVVGGKEGDAVTVKPFRRAERAGKVLRKIDKREVDVALVEVSDPIVDGASQPDADPQPAVLLYEEPLGKSFRIVGAPDQNWLNDTRFEPRDYPGNSGYDENGRCNLINISDGRLQGGQSGGATLDLRAAAVVGHAFYSESLREALGGGAVPVRVTAEELPEVRRLCETPPPATRRWREIVGEPLWAELGKPRVHWDRALTVTVSGTARGWTVRCEADGAAPCAITHRELPDGVSEALFSWAQQRPAKTIEDIRLLGELLRDALFPKPDVAARIARVAQAESCTIRLAFDLDSALAEVPWEMLALEPAPNGKLRFLAADRTLMFVRDARHPDLRKLPAEPSRAASARVLVLAVAQTPDAARGDGWNDRATREIRDDFTRSLLVSQRIERRFLAVLPNDAADDPAFDIERIGDYRGDIFHYVGFARVQRDKPQIALPDAGSVQWYPLESFFEKVRETEARLLALEFRPAPQTEELEPVPCKYFHAALGARLGAVIYTRRPVSDARKFNSALYAALGRGETVEAAVQTARRSVHASTPVNGDAAAFANFCLLEAAVDDFRLLAPTTGDSAAQGRKLRPSAPETPGDEGGGAGRPRDGFEPDRGRFGT